MPNTQKTRLAPCPFCGSEAEGPPEDTLGPGATYWLECMNVTCSALIEGDTRAEVIKAWNTRADDVTGHLEDLAVHIYEARYKRIAPEWEPLDDALGIITQIDNMIVGILEDKKWKKS